MNRLLLALNVAAAGSILATNSAALLTAISPYGNRASPSRAPAVQQAQAIVPARPAVSATPVRVTVSGFVAPTASRQDSLALETATLP
jgi:hypothetical protein